MAETEYPAIETVYKGYRFRSRLEARWAVYFDALGIRYEYEPQGFDLGAVGYYLPDFYLPDFEAWVEIKPESGSKVRVLRQLAALIKAGVSKPEQAWGFFGDPLSAYWLVPEYYPSGRRHSRSGKRANILPGDDLPGWKPAFPGEGTGIDFSGSDRSEKLEPVCCHNEKGAEEFARALNEKGLDGRFYPMMPEFFLLQQGSINAKIFARQARFEHGSLLAGPITPPDYIEGIFDEHSRRIKTVSRYGARQEEEEMHDFLRAAQKECVIQYINEVLYDKTLCFIWLTQQGRGDFNVCGIIDRIALSTLSAYQDTVGCAQYGRSNLGAA